MRKKLVVSIRNSFVLSFFWVLVKFKFVLYFMMWKFFTLLVFFLSCVLPLKGFLSFPSSSINSFTQDSFRFSLFADVGNQWGHRKLSKPFRIKARKSFFLLFFLLLVTQERIEFLVMLKSSLTVGNQLLFILFSFHLRSNEFIEGTLFLIFSVYRREPVTLCLKVYFYCLLTA